MASQLLVRGTLRRELLNNWVPAFRQRCPCHSKWFRANGARGWRRWYVAGVAVVGVGSLAAYGLFAPPGSKLLLPPPVRTQCEPASGTCEGITLTEAIQKSRDMAQRIKDETGSPGLVVGVSVNGKQVWKEVDFFSPGTPVINHDGFLDKGFGYADIENRVPCTPDTVLRIASISKSITMAAVGKMWETGKLDLDKPVQHYVSAFPEKTFSDKKVMITTRQLLCHLGGIRHYSRAYMLDKDSNEKSGKSQKHDSRESKGENLRGDTQYPEFHLKDNFKNIKESLELFKNDPLVHKPGTKFLYTTHGWTLISAVLEGASGIPFSKMIKEVFKELGLENTYLDETQPLIYNRGRYYTHNSKGRIINCPYVDVSYKWAGGGMLSTVGDLLKFGEAMLYSYQHTPNQEPVPIRNVEGYLKAETVREMWTPVKGADSKWSLPCVYGLGWCVVPEQVNHAYCQHQKHCILHTGAAMGASSVLLVLPQDGSSVPPHGVIVAVIANLSSIGLSKTALMIAETFYQLQS